VFVDRLFKFSQQVHTIKESAQFLRSNQEEITHRYSTCMYYG
jgi:hypothetical protein